MISNNLLIMGYIALALIIMTLFSACLVIPKSRGEKTLAVIMSCASILLALIYFLLLLFTVIPSGFYSVPVSLYFYDDNTGEELFETGFAEIDLQRIDKYELVAITDSSNNVLFQDIGMSGVPENEEEFEVYAKKGVIVSATIQPIALDQLDVSPVDIIQADIPGTACCSISLIINLFVITKFALTSHSSDKYIA